MKAAAWVAGKLPGYRPTLADWLYLKLRQGDGGQ